jgi:hypothetical protein
MSSFRPWATEYIPTKFDNSCRFSGKKKVSLLAKVATFGFGTGSNDYFELEALINFRV